ncbi:MAG: hypothetical protein DMG21_02560 [Acidobacteria bacterium]|nr:MAG: hypothetical protein DMG21_02560 [Acidobacteriota bacterium]
MTKATSARKRKPKVYDGPKTAPKRAAAGSNGRRSAFRGQKSIQELAAEQGVTPTRLEDILGKGRDLWESDRELEQFVEDIYSRRREGRELAKR